MKWIAALVAIIFSLAIAGCATIFGYDNRTIAVNSIPEGASVYVNNILIGTTPTSVTLDDIHSTNLIVLQTPGYQPASMTINSTFQSVGWWNVLFPPGFLVDAITGDMKTIPCDSRILNVRMKQL